jgi:hypothetical protein
MKFLVVIPVLRHLFQLLSGIGRKKEYEEDWSNPSEHNVWW